MRHVTPVVFYTKGGLSVRQIGDGRRSYVDNTCDGRHVTTKFL